MREKEAHYILNGIETIQLRIIIITIIITITITTITIILMLSWADKLDIIKSKIDVDCKAPLD